MTIYEFAKLTYLKKALLIKSQATFLDVYSDKKIIVEIYSLNDFFIELLIDPYSPVPEIIPYKRGFSLKKTVSPLQSKKNPVLYGQAA